MVRGVVWTLRVRFFLIDVMHIEVCDIEAPSECSSPVRLVRQRGNARYQPWAPEGLG